VAQLGHYDPSKKILKVDLEKYEKWAKSGAKPSETVAALYKRYKKQQAKK
jgi:ribosomal protein S16